MGDFNEVFDVNERLGLKEKSDARLAKFREAIEKTILLEMQTRHGLFTWSNGLIGNRRSDYKLCHCQ